MINNTIDKKEANKIFKNAVEKECGDSIEKINTAIRKSAEHCKDYIEIFESITMGLVFRVENEMFAINLSEYKKLVRYYRKFGYTVVVENEEDKRRSLKITISW